MILNEKLKDILEYIYQYNNDIDWWKTKSEKVLKMEISEIFKGLQQLYHKDMIDLESSGSLDSVSKIELKRKGFNYLHDIGFIDDSDFSIIRTNYKN